jgi:hypothetical protein
MPWPCLVPPPGQHGLHHHPSMAYVGLRRLVGSSVLSSPPPRETSPSSSDRTSHRAVLHGSRKWYAPHHITPHRVAPHRIAPYRVTPNCTASRHTAPRICAFSLLPVALLSHRQWRPLYSSNMYSVRPVVVQHACSCSTVNLPYAGSFGPCGLPLPANIRHIAPSQPLFVPQNRSISVGKH